MTTLDPLAMIQPKRKPLGMSAILLPFRDNGDIDWPAFDAHVVRTAEAGLVPAVNMDTGFGNLIDDATKRMVLERTEANCKQFVAGAFVGDKPGDVLDMNIYLHAMYPIMDHGGMPVIFQSYGLLNASDDRLIRFYEDIGNRTRVTCGGFIGFELGTMFAPFGKIYSIEVYRQAFLQNAGCIGAKHSSLSRELEWQRLLLRDEVRPDFKVFTGNDLAIDMIMYGSDYLLGLSTMAPDLFAKRDAMWVSGDPGFYELNDALQYLGFFAFRDPVPAYKHTAAMFLKLRGWLNCDDTHPQSPKRPESDREVLKAMLPRLLR